MRVPPRLKQNPRQAQRRRPETRLAAAASVFRKSSRTTSLRARAYVLEHKTTLFHRSSFTRAPSWKIEQPFLSRGLYTYSFEWHTGVVLSFFGIQFEERKLVGARGAVFIYTRECERSIDRVCSTSAFVSFVLVGDEIIFARVGLCLCALIR